MDMRAQGTPGCFATYWLVEILPAKTYSEGKTVLTGSACLRLFHCQQGTLHSNIFPPTTVATFVMISSNLMTSAARPDLSIDRERARVRILGTSEFTGLSTNYLFIFLYVCYLSIKTYPGTPGWLGC